MNRAESSLDEGAKALTIRQKHIKIADRSDLSSATVKHYMANPLADGPEDEKEIARSEKEALKGQERANAKKVPKRGGGKSRKPRQDYHQQNPSFRYEPYNDFGRREQFALPTPPMPQRQFRPRVLRPCFCCGAYGYIQSSCTAPARQYPFLQPVVSTSAELEFPACVDKMCCCEEYVYMGSGECNEGVDNTVCHPKEEKACVSREGVCSLALNSSVDKVTDTKVDKKLVSKVTAGESASNEGSECIMMGDHSRARDLQSSSGSPTMQSPKSHMYRVILNKSLIFGKMCYKLHHQYSIA